MENFVAESCDLRISLRFCFFLKKSVTEAHRMLVEAYGKHALSERQCRNWFQRFKSNDFDVRNEERGRPPKKFEDTELQAILNADDTLTQTQIADALNVDRSTISIRLNTMGKIQKYLPPKRKRLNNNAVSITNDDASTSNSQLEINRKTKIDHVENVTQIVKNRRKTARVQNLPPKRRRLNNNAVSITNDDASTLNSQLEINREPKINEVKNVRHIVKNRRKTAGVQNSTHQNIEIEQISEKCIIKNEDCGNNRNVLPYGASDDKTNLQAEATSNKDEPSTNIIYQTHFTSFAVKIAHTCDLCSASFSHKTDLDIHIRTHVKREHFTEDLLPTNDIENFKSELGNFKSELGDFESE